MAEVVTAASSRHRRKLEEMYADAVADEEQALRDEAVHDEQSAVASAARAWNRAQEAKERKQALLTALEAMDAASEFVAPMKD